MEMHFGNTMNILRIPKCTMVVPSIFDYEATIYFSKYRVIFFQKIHILLKGEDGTGLIVDSGG